MIKFIIFSRGHATLHLAVWVGTSVGQSVRHIFGFRAVFALLLLPNRPRMDCPVSGLVYMVITYDREKETSQKRIHWVIDYFMCIVN